jgi:hemoglobin
LVDEAHHRVPPAGFKYLVTEMVCWAAGGPQKYSGKSIGGPSCPIEDYRRGAGGVPGRLSADAGKFAVPAEEQAELRAIINSTRSAIVVASGGQSPRLYAGRREEVHG